MPGMFTLRVGAIGVVGVIGDAFAQRDAVPDGDLLGSDEDVSDEQFEHAAAFVEGGGLGPGVLNRPGFGGDSLVGSGDQTGQVTQLVQGLELGRWPVSAGSVKSPIVVPVHPCRGGHVDFIQSMPRAPRLYQLGLVQTDC